MSEPFLSEIRIMGFNFAPRGWALCDGQILPINQNQSLYSLLGTTYGGDGRTTFALPDLRSRSPMHRGTGFPLGQKTGAETHTLLNTEMPAHTHTAVGESETADQVLPSGNQLGGAVSAYTSSAPGVVPLQANTIGSAGGSQAHENRQPYLTVSFCIALQGLFPSRN